MSKRSVFYILAGALLLVTILVWFYQGKPEKTERVGQVAFPTPEAGAQQEQTPRGPVVPTPLRRPTPRPTSTPAGQSLITGRVTSFVGQPLDGAEVFLWEWLPPDSPGLADMVRPPIPRTGASVAATVTDATGTYRFPFLEAGHYIVTAKAPGFALNGIEVIGLGAQESRVARDLLLYPASWMGGWVLDEHRRALAGATIHAWRIEKGPVSPGARWNDFGTVTSDSQGAFSFDHLEHGRYTLKVSARGFAGGEVSEVPTESTNVIIIMGRGLEIRGRVQNSVGRPIAGAEIQVQLIGGSPGAPGVLPVPRLLLEQSAQTDSRGFFVLKGLPLPAAAEQTLSLLAMAPGFQTASVPVPAGDAPSLVREVSITLPEGATLAGRVQNETGKALTGAQIEVLSARDSAGQKMPPARLPWRSFFTTRSGSFELYGLPPGWVDLKCSATGYAAQLIQDVSTAIPSLTVTLRSGGAILGRVVSADAPVTGLSGVRVNAMRLSPPPAELEPYLTISDEAGDFRIEGLPAGRYTLWAVYGTPFGSERLEVELEDGQILSNVVITVHSQQAIRGKVLSQEDQQPVAGAEVIAMSDRGHRRATTDAGGLFALEGLVPGLWNLGVRAEGFVPLLPGEYPSPAISLGQGEVRQDIVLSVQRGARVFGRTVDSQGHPVPQVVVFTQPPSGVSDKARFPTVSTTTDAQGYFDLSNVVEEHELVIVADHLRYVPYRSPVLRLSDGEEKNLGAIRLEPAGVLLGRITNAAGEPVVGRIVVEQLSAVSHADGTFRLERAPQGTRKASVTAAGHQAKELLVTITPAAQAEPIEVVLDALPSD